jgi:cation:H+ antiporter
MFVAGAALLIYSAEKLIGYLVGIACRLKVSLFLLAVVFTGIEFDDIFLGVALNLEDLDDVALGVVFGTALSMTGVVLAVAAILTPTRVTIPRDYVVLLAGAPLVMIPLTLVAPLTAVHGVLLLALTVVLFGYLVHRETRVDTPVFRDAEIVESFGIPRRSGGSATAVRPDGVTTGGTGPGGDGPRQDFADAMPFGDARGHSPLVGIGLAVLALTGLVAGAGLTGMGTEGMLEAYGLEGTIFGATIATAVLAVEDIFLTVEPIRRGVPEIGVGNVIGSVLFSVSGKLGVILLAGGIVVEEDVLVWHLPALVVVTALGAYVVSTGRLRRWHGVVLLGLYVAYWIASYVLFGAAPVEVG